ncbi:TRAP transporter small permease [Marinobacterium aestuariivivens]|uniref:TRAP transporter small permease protein n=1 Tax=Marinobacterium aestuariivivens TaxID=1698799 RepID=A0ABW2A9G6_9GAMM
MGMIRRLGTQLSGRINLLNQWVVGLLMAALLIDVWIGVLDRYLLHWQISWVEELARYIMIWAILLAVPCCSAAREHIGLTTVTSKLPRHLRRHLGILVDLLCVLFFGYIAFAGAGLVMKGLQQLSTVFGLPMAYPYAAIPVAFGLAAFQSLFALLRWFEPGYDTEFTESELEKASAQ